MKSQMLHKGVSFQIQGAKWSQGGKEVKMRVHPVSNHMDQPNEDAFQP